MYSTFIRFQQRSNDYSFYSSVAWYLTLQPRLARDLTFGTFYTLKRSSLWDQYTAMLSTNTAPIDSYFRLKTSFPMTALIARCQSSHSSGHSPYTLPYAHLLHGHTALNPRQQRLVVKYFCHNLPFFNYTQRPCTTCPTTILDRGHANDCVDAYAHLQHHWTIPTGTFPLDYAITHLNARSSTSAWLVIAMLLHRITSL